MINKPVMTNWGMVDSARPLGPVVDGKADGWQVTTSRHGGVILSAKAMERIPAAFLSAGYGVLQNHFEEDENWAIVVYYIPEWFTVSAWMMAVSAIQRIAKRVGAEVVPQA